LKLKYLMMSQKQESGCGGNGPRLAVENSGPTTVQESLPASA